MPINLVIANFAGSVRETAPAAEAAVPAVPAGHADAQASSTTAVPASQPVGDVPSNPPGLTPAFTLVVMELLNEHGTVIATVPSQQQLAAYREGLAIPPS
jgi:hypothetical protein